MYPRPKYLLIVFALAGDSTITSDLAIVFYYIPRASRLPLSAAQPGGTSRAPPPQGTDPVPSHRNPALAGGLQQDFQKLLTR